jgi:hypothetical protein
MRFMIVAYPNTADEEIVADGFTTRYQACRAMSEEIDQLGVLHEVVEDLRGVVE